MPTQSILWKKTFTDAKKLLVQKKKLISILAYFSILFGQFSDPAEFKFNINNTNQGEVVVLEVQANIEDEWHIYAIYDVPEGPAPTVINVVSNEIVKVGKIIEPEPVVEYDEGFDNITKKHLGNPLFQVPIILDKNVKLLDKENREKNKK